MSDIDEYNKEQREYLDRKPRESYRPMNWPTTVSMLRVAYLNGRQEPALLIEDTADAMLEGLESVPCHIKCNDREILIDPAFAFEEWGRGKWVFIPRGD